MVVIGNGLNIGNANGNVQDLAPLISSLAKIIAEGQITSIVNALNLGIVRRVRPKVIRHQPAEPALQTFLILHAAVTNS